MHVCNWANETLPSVAMYCARFCKGHLSDERGDGSDGDGRRRHRRVVSPAITLRGWPPMTSLVRSVRRVKFVRCARPCRHNLLRLWAGSFEIVEPHVLCSLRTVLLCVMFQCMQSINTLKSQQGAAVSRS